MPRPAWPALVLLGALVAAPATGQAHPNHAGLPSSRYVTLEIQRGQLRLAYSLVLTERPAERLRRRADSDGDGRVTPAEAGALVDKLAREIGPALRVDVDGVAHTPVLRGKTSVAAAEPVSRQPLAVDLEWRLPLAAGRRRLRFIDELVPPEPAPVELTIRVGEGARTLSEQAKNRDPRGRYHYGTRTGQRLRSARLEAGEVALEVEIAPPPARLRAGHLWAGAGTVVAIGLGLLVRARRRRRVS